jgi:hypothetical protein
MLAQRHTDADQPPHALPWHLNLLLTLHRPSLQPILVKPLFLVPTPPLLLFHTYDPFPPRPITIATRSTASHLVSALPSLRTIMTARRHLPIVSIRQRLIRHQKPFGLEGRVLGMFERE